MNLVLIRGYEISKVLDITKNLNQFIVELGQLGEFLELVDYSVCNNDILIHLYDRSFSGGGLNFDLTFPRDWFKSHLIYYVEPEERYLRIRKMLVNEILKFKAEELANGT